MSANKSKSKSTPKKELQQLIEQRGSGRQVRYDTKPFIDGESGEEKGFQTELYCPPLSKFMQSAFISEGFGWSKQQSQQAAAQNALNKYKQNMDGMEDSEQLSTMEDKIQRIQQESCSIISNLVDMQKKCVALTNLMLEVQHELNTIHNKRKLNEIQDFEHEKNIKSGRLENEDLT